MGDKSTILTQTHMKSHEMTVIDDMTYVVSCAWLLWLTSSNSLNIYLNVNGMKIPRIRYDPKSWMDTCIFTYYIYIYTHNMCVYCSSLHTVKCTTNNFTEHKTRILGHQIVEVVLENIIFLASDTFVVSRFRWKSSHPLEVSPIQWPQIVHGFCPKARLLG